MGARRYRDGRAELQAVLSLRDRSGSPAQPDGGLVWIEGQKLVADAEIVDVPVLSGQVERDVDLVGVKKPEAGRHHNLLVSDFLEALRDDVVAVDAHRALDRAQEAPRLRLGG